MKNFRIVLMLVMFMGMQSIFALESEAEPSPTASEFTPDTEDRVNPELSNTLPGVRILPLKGTDCDGLVIESFAVLTLPSSESGTLYLEDCTTEISSNQTLNAQESSTLCFDPSATFTGDSTFTYTSIDSNGLRDPSPATVTIPVIDGAANNSEPSTADITHDAFLNTITSVSVLALRGTDANGNEIERFVIRSLPDEASGVLFLEDCETEVTVNQELSAEQASTLCFIPNENFVGDATFTYSSVDATGLTDSSAATVTIPFIAEGTVNPNPNPTPPGEGGTGEPTTDNIKHPEVLNTVASLTVLPLSGKDANGSKVEHFIIKTLPNPKSGVLYLQDCKTKVTVGQELNAEQASTLCFIPTKDFIGNATFRYSSVDSNGLVDSSPATVTIPLVDHTVHNENCSCESYESSIPAISNVGTLLMFILTLLLGSILIRKEI